MASGDRQRTWFPEMVALLRAEWQAAIPWDQMIALRDRLDEMLHGIRKSRHIQSVTTSTLCSHCGRPMVQGAGSVSVRAMILALKRFGIAPEDEVKSLKKNWNRYRRETGIDINGKFPHKDVTM